MTDYLQIQLSKRSIHLAAGFAFILALATAWSQDASPSGPSPSAPAEAAAKENAPKPSPAAATPTTTPVAPGSQFNSNNRTVPPAETDSPLSIVGSDPSALELIDCYRMAAIRSDTLQIDEQGIRAARAQLYQAVAALCPTVTLVNSENFQKSASAAGSFTIQGGSVTSNGGKLYSNATRLQLSQTLFNGFTNYNNISAQDANVAEQGYTLQYGYQTLYQEVAQSFYQILMNEADLVVEADSIRALQGQVDLLEKWVHIGRARPSELLQTKSQLAGVKVSEAQTKGLLAADRELMAFYLGIPATTIKLRDTQKFPTAGNLEGYLRSVGTRPDILAQVEAERVATHQLYAAQGALLPTVSATGNYNLTTYPQQTQEWTAALEISLPLFDGGLIINQIKQQKALTRESELNVENLRRTDDQNLRTAFDNFDSSAAQVVALQEEVEMSALNYNAQADDYKSGIVTNLDVLTALSTLQTARQQLSDAEVTARLDLVQLHVAAGLVPTSLPNAKKPQSTAANQAATKSP